MLEKCKPKGLCAYCVIIVNVCICNNYYNRKNTYIYTWSDFEYYHFQATC